MSRPTSKDGEPQRDGAVDATLQRSTGQHGDHAVPLRAALARRRVHMRIIEKGAVIRLDGGRALAPSNDDVAKVTPPPDPTATAPTMQAVEHDAGAGTDAGAELEPGAGTAAEPQRLRLAERLTHFARLRRQEEEERARAEAALVAEAERAKEPAYVVSEAVPLERLGFMGLMLRPPGVIHAPPQPTSAATGGAQIPAPADAVPMLHLEAPKTKPDISHLMEAYRAAQAAEAARDMLAPLGPPAGPPPADLVVTASAVAAPAPTPTPVSDALSSLDPIRRLAGAIQAVDEAVTAPSASPGPVAPAPMTATMPIMPEPRLDSAAGPSAVTASLHQPAMAMRSAVAPPRVSQSGWPGFAAGFAVAMVCGVGLYLYLIGG